MLKKIFVMSVLSAIILASLIGAVNAEQGMLTYTNEEYGFSIGYPEDWTVEEGFMGSVVIFWGPIKDDYIINVIVVTEELPTKMTAEEYAKAGREWYLEEYDIVKTLSDTINGEPVAGDITTSMMEGIEVKQMSASFVKGTTAYTITFSATSSAYDGADDDYFDPMLRSFKFIEKVAGIEIQNFIVTPSKVETGEEVKVKFEAMNEADVEKTKTFHLVDTPPGTELPEEIDFKTVTLAPGETEIIEFTFIPREAGERMLSVEDQYWIIAVTEARPEITPVPGFEAVFVIAGLFIGSRISFEEEMKQQGCTRF